MNGRTRRAAGALLAPALFGWLAVATASAQNIAVRNATILTVTNGTIENGTVIIRNGKITAVGKDVSVPAGMQVIDATGKYVMPGILDAHSHLGTDTGLNEGAESVTPEVKVEVRGDALNIYRALAGGVTTLNVLHGSANVIGGQAAVVKLRFGEPAEALLVDDAPRIVKFALGENPKRSNSNPQPGQERRFPATRMGVEQTLRWWFNQAVQYKQAWTDYSQAVKKDKTTLPPRRDLRLEALADIIDGKLWVHAHSYREDEIMMLMKVAEDYGFRVKTFQHVLEGYKVADEIARHGAGASTFADMWAYKMEAWDAIPHNAALMTKRGVKVSINSDSDERVRRLYQEAALTMKYGGATETEALSMITINPAWQLGLDQRVGSIEVGKDGDLAIFSGHPFAPASKVEKTIIEGKVYFDLDTAMTLQKLLQRIATTTTESQP
ncbi:MAG TPA: amidohydrolase [Longimicrobiales bacterium]|nr:amidohydrolase [Longimicrobiales bacterium]